MPAEDVAADLAKALLCKKPPRYVSTGSNVRLYSLLGFMQCWLCPGKISNLFQEKFGLKLLESRIKLGHSAVKTQC